MDPRTCLIVDDSRIIRKVARRILEDLSFDVAEAAPNENDVQPVVRDETKRRGLIEATDLVKDRFGERAVRFGRELRGEGNTTGSASKNPADYK